MQFLFPRSGISPFTQICILNDSTDSKWKFCEETLMVHKTMSFCGFVIILGSLKSSESELSNAPKTIAILQKITVLQTSKVTVTMDSYSMSKQADNKRDNTDRRVLYISHNNRNQYDRASPL